MCCLCRLLSPFEYVCSSPWKLPFFLQSLGLLLRWPQHRTFLPSPEFSFWSQLIQHCDIYTRKSISFLQQGPVMPFLHSLHLCFGPALSPFLVLWVTSSSSQPAPSSESHTSPSISGYLSTPNQLFPSFTCLPAPLLNLSLQSSFHSEESLSAFPPTP